jgi:hypothetical protein
VLVGRWLEEVLDDDDGLMVVLGIGLGVDDDLEVELGINDKVAGTVVESVELIRVELVLEVLVRGGVDFVGLGGFGLPPFTGVSTWLLSQ